MRIAAGPGIATSKPAVDSAITARAAAAARDGPSVARTASSLYLCSDRAAPTFSSMTSDFVADLSHNALLAVTGDDATQFLNAQLTNDVQALHAGEGQWNGWWSARGRVLATLLVLRRRDGHLLLLRSDAPA